MGLPTLSDFYYSTYMEMKILDKLDPKTRKSYEESVAWWCRLTGDPALDEIDDMMCARFIRDLGQQKGKLADKMMRSSIGKHCVNLQSILQFAGPKNGRCRGRELIVDVPYFDPPRQDQEPPCRDWSTSEVASMWRAADCMTSPQLEGVNPIDWWKCLIVVAYFTGLRIKALTSVEFSMIHECWLTVPARLSKRRKGKKQYLRREALEHIEKIRGTAGRTVILQWPRWEQQRRTCYTELRKLQTASGIPKHRQFPFQSFRKTHLTVIASGEVDPNAGIRTAQASAGHTSSAVTVGHYVSGTVQDRLVAAAIDAMPSPCA